MVNSSLIHNTNTNNCPDLLNPTFRHLGFFSFEMSAGNTVYFTYIKDNIFDIEMALFLKAVKPDVDDVTTVVKVTKMENDQIFTFLKYEKTIFDRKFSKFMKNIIVSGILPQHPR